MNRSKITKHLNSKYGNKVMCAVYGTNDQRHGIKVTKAFIEAVELFTEAVIATLSTDSFTPNLLLGGSEDYHGEDRLATEEIERIKILIAKSCGIPPKFLYREDDASTT